MNEESCWSSSSVDFLSADMSSNLGYYQFIKVGLFLAVRGFVSQTNAGRSRPYPSLLFHNL
jgi:hypothetical protein